MQTISDDYVIKAAEGDIDAFEHIYKAMSAFVYNVAFRISNRKEDAEEVTQDVFVKIYRNLKNFEFKSSFKTWAYRITVNSALNVYKKKAKELSKRSDYEFTMKTQAAVGTLNNAMESDDSERMVQSLLSKLRPDQRTCIILREIEGLSYQEIADTLKTNINTIRTRLKRARLAIVNLKKEVS